MEEGDEIKENYKLVNKRQILANVIAIILLVEGIIFCLSSIIFSISDTSDKWFTRLSIGLICFGFSGIILKQK